MKASRRQTRADASIKTPFCLFDAGSKTRRPPQVTFQVMSVSGLNPECISHYFINFVSNFVKMISYRYLPTPGWQQDIKATMAQFQLMLVSVFHPESIRHFFILNFVSNFFKNDFQPAHPRLAARYDTHYRANSW
jgi:hypothetical protein